MSESEQERAYWTHEVADKLQISHSTLKRWCSELEASGYKFTKGTNESRAFTAHDLSALEKYKYLTKKQKIPKDTAASTVTEEFSKNMSAWAPPAHKENDHFSSSPQAAQTLQTLMQRFQEQEEMNRQILQELKTANELNKTISSQYEQLKQEIQALNDNQKLIASSQEKKQGFWAKLFAKNKDV
ncbi:MerR family transcriptional regulator [Bacillus gaemokensis]|uniref:DNA-binding protein n=1 Tax=Bacillus gaemokensis TaxID=574375 RepID=A0A073K6J5_9BACI|nr:MerR family transcriptional regulator [Bacillus gaemokensis]KEK22161.1 DNA-binding protein [Bacillus gaemokensis]KYG35598.1 DNA-binding protein [Bacillus gaemokensis]